MGELSELNETGDVKVKWNRDNPWEIHQAREQFNRLRKKGYIAHVMRGGNPTVLEEFDETADSIIMSPLPRGG